MAVQFIGQMGHVGSIMCLLLLVVSAHERQPPRADGHCLKDGCSSTTSTEGSRQGSAHISEARQHLLKYRPKTILYWTSFYGHHDFEFGFGNQPFVDAACAVTNCVATADRSLVGEADAVLFHMRNINGNTQLPVGRKESQRYVFFLLENPYHQWNNLQEWDSFFNLTMTYRRDSDVPVYYGRTEKIVTSYNSSQIRSEHEKSTNSRPMIRPTPTNGRVLVAWFVSNCKTHSKREQYVNELQKYIMVDVYGKCGPLECPTHMNIPDKRMVDACYDMLEENYKFYLSFENIHCKDYVTEKLFNILGRDVIPVVMGGTNYTRDAPPRSFINVDDFQSPRDLAAFLTSLADSPVDYERYFHWKSTHRVWGPRQTYKESFCRLCELLNDPNYPTKTYNKLNKWWGKETVCDKNAFDKLKNGW